MRRNSVLVGLRDKKFETIHEDSKRFTELQTKKKDLDRCLQCIFTYKQA